MARLRARIDANQPALVMVIRRLGASFQHTHQIPRALDGIVGYCGIDQRVEIKDPKQDLNKRALTPAEDDVFLLWRGRKPVVLETDQDVINLLANMRREAF